jgi:hypothetical protein
MSVLTGWQINSAVAAMLGGKVDGYGEYRKRFGLKG